MTVKDHYGQLPLVHNNFDTPHIEYYAKLKGLTLKSSVNGPLLRLEAFSSEDNIKPVGYLTAFIRPVPLGTLHLDTIQVKNRRQTLGFRRKGWSIDGSGISFVMGRWVLLLLVH